MTAAFLYSEGSLCGFFLEGHCGGNAGTDIVCAAVSSAAYLTANTITEVIGAAAEIQVDDTGRMDVRLSPADRARCAEVLEGFRLHMAQLADQYPQQIQLIKAEV